MLSLFGMSRKVINLTIMIPIVIYRFCLRAHKILSGTQRRLHCLQTLSDIGSPKDWNTQTCKILIPLPVTMNYWTFQFFYVWWWNNGPPELIENAMIGKFILPAKWIVMGEFLTCSITEVINLWSCLLRSKAYHHTDRLHTYHLQHLI